MRKMNMYNITTACKSLIKYTNVKNCGQNLFLFVNDLHLYIEQVANKNVFAPHWRPHQLLFNGRKSVFVSRLVLFHHEREYQVDYKQE